MTPDAPEIPTIRRCGTDLAIVFVPATATGTPSLAWLQSLLRAATIPSSADGAWSGVRSGVEHLTFSGGNNEKICNSRRRDCDGDFACRLLASSQRQRRNGRRRVFRVGQALNKFA